MARQFNVAAASGKNPAVKVPAPRCGLIGKRCAVREDLTGRYQQRAFYGQVDKLRCAKGSSVYAIQQKRVILVHAAAVFVFRNGFIPANVPGDGGSVLTLQCSFSFSFEMTYSLENSFRKQKMRP